MPGKRSLYRIVGCLKIPYLADHYYVGVLPEYSPQAACKGDTDLGLDRGLVEFSQTISTGSSIVVILNSESERLFRAE